MTSFSLTSSVPALVLFNVQNHTYSRTALTHTVLSLIFQMVLHSSQKGNVDSLSLADFASLSSTCKFIYINSQLIWKNLLVHYHHGFDHGFLKKQVLNTIHAVTYKVIFLQLTKLRISFETPHLVFQAAERGCKEMRDLLVANENRIYTKVADVFVRKGPMPNPTNHKAFVRALKKDINIFKKRDKEEGWTPLLHASLAGDIDLVRALLAYQAFCKKSDNQIKNSFNIDDRNNEGYTALCYAVMHGHLEITRTLLENKANVDATDAFQSTPLLEATVSGDRETVSLLLEHGANIEKADAYGKTPLMHAAEEGQLEILHFLIENNADVKAKDLSGRTPGFYASYQHSKLATEDSQTQDNNPDKLTTHNAAMRQAEIVKALLQALADLKEKEGNARLFSKKRKFD